MSIKTRIAATALAAIVLTGSIAATTEQAQAHPHGLGLGLALGLGTAAVLGAAAASHPVYDYDDDDGYLVRRCWFEPRYNVFGQYIGSIRECRYN